MATRPVAGLILEPDIRLVRERGSGAFGVVWEALHERDGRRCAVKFIDRKSHAGQIEENAINFMKGIYHQNLVCLEDVMTTDADLILVMELADRTLYQRFTEAEREGLSGIPSEELLDYLEQAAFGIDHLNITRHLIGESLVHIRHRDIKPDNILLFGRAVKVADYGLIKVTDHPLTHHTGRMTRLYAPPEFFLPDKVASTSDQYSLALTYCRLLTGAIPAMSVNYVRDLSELPVAERDVVQRALSLDPDDRWRSCSDFIDELRLARRAQVSGSTSSDGAKPTEAEAADVKSLLQAFEAPFGSLLRLAQLSRKAGTPGKRAALVESLAEDALCASEIWDGIVKHKAAPDPWQVPLLVQKLPRLEALLCDHWPGDGLGEALPYRQLARVFAQVLASLASWLARDIVAKRDWTTFRMSQSGAGELVRGALRRWAEAIEGRGIYPQGLQEVLRMALDRQSFPRLPAALDRFDPSMLDTFLQAFLRRVEYLARLPGGLSELRNFVEEAACDFWDATVDHCRWKDKDKGAERIGKIGRDVFPYLFRAVSRQAPEVLRVLPRVIRAFELDRPDGDFRPTLQPALQEVHGHLRAWEEWRDHPPFFRTLCKAHRDGLRASVTGMFRVASRYSLEGKEIHIRPDVQPHLADRSGGLTLSCALEDLSQDLTGLRFAVPAGRAVFDGPKKVAGFLLGGDVVPARDCVVRLPFDLPEDQAGGLQSAGLEFTCVWGRTEGGVARIGALVVEAQAPGVKALADYLTHRFHFSFKPSPKFLA